MSLIFSDHGHQRGQNKVPDTTFRSRELHKWFDFYVKGIGTTPYQGVQTLTQVCGAPSNGATGAFDDFLSVIYQVSKANQGGHVVW